MARKCIISGIKTLVDVENCELLDERLPQFLCDFEGEAELTVSVTEKGIKKYTECYPNSDRQIALYNISGSKFYAGLLEYNGFMIHSSCIGVNGKAFIFSAPCGTGKSTHTGYWKQVLGENNVIFINDDKPAVRYIEAKGFEASGTPWSGKNNITVNVSLPLGAVCFLERAEENYIRPLSSNEFLRRLLPQTTRPNLPEKMDKFLDLAEKMYSQVPMYVLGVENNVGAAEFAMGKLL